MARRIDTKKAEENYIKAQQQDFIDSIESIEIHQTVKEMIKEAKDRWGIGKISLARILNVDKTTIQAWEKNNTRKEMVYWALKGMRRAYHLHHNVIKLNLEENEENE